MICTFSRVANVSHTDDVPHPDGPEIKITGASSFVPVFSFLEEDQNLKKNTRMYSSGMRTARLLTVSPHALRGGGLPEGCLPGGVCPGGVWPEGGVCPGGMSASGPGGCSTDRHL